MFTLFLRKNPLSPLDLVNLSPLMRITSGQAATRIALIDGPVSKGHSELSNNILEVSAKIGGTCASASSAACVHGNVCSAVRRMATAIGHLVWEAGRGGICRSSDVVFDLLVRARLATISKRQRAIPASY